MNSDKASGYDQMKADKAQEIKDAAAVPHLENDGRIPMYDEMRLKEEEDKAVPEPVLPPAPDRSGEARIPMYEAMLKEQEEERVKEKAAADARRGEFKMPLYEGMIKDQANPRATTEAETAVQKSEREFLEKQKPFLNSLGAIEPKEVVPETPEEIKFNAALAELERNRNYFNGELKDGKWTGVEGQFQEKYEAFLKNQGAFNVINAPLKMFGIRPRLPKELRQLEAASYVARQQYFESSRKLAELKGTVATKGVSSEARKNRLDKQGRNVYERHQSMLAHKLIIGVGNERIAVQEKIGMERDKSGRIRETLMKVREFNQKTKGWRWASMAVGYGVLGAAASTGGAFVAAGVGGLAGGAYLGRLAFGLKAGAVAGTGLRAAGERTVKHLQGQLQESEVAVRKDFFKQEFSALEAEIDRRNRRIDEAKASAKIASAGGAVIAGLAAGNLSGGVLDALDIGFKGTTYPDQKDTDLGPVPEKPKEPFYPPQKDADLGPIGEAPKEPFYPPNNEDADYSPVIPKGDVPEDVKPPAAIEMGDARIAEEMHPKVVEALRPAPIKQMGDLSVMEEMQALSDKAKIPVEMGDARVAEEVQELARSKVTIPVPGLENVPPELVRDDLAEPKVADKGPFEGKLDNKLPEDGNSVTEKDIEDKQTEKPLIENEGGPKPEDWRTPHVSSEPAEVESEETEPDVPQIIHTVVDKDNVWNIMEGKGPDANPIGGKSELLKGMTPQEREAALNAMVDYYKDKPEEARAIGAVRSGDINKVWPGEQINVTMIDNKLRELLGMNLPAEAPIPEPRPDVLPTEAPIPEARPDTLPENPPIPESRPQTMPLEAPIPEPRPDTLPQNAPIPETRPQTLPTEAPIPEARPEIPAVKSPELIAADVAKYVTQLEQPRAGIVERVFFGGGPNYAGSYEGKIELLTFDQIRQNAQSGNLEVVANTLGVSEEGYKAWMQKLAEEVQKVPPLSGQETVGQYVTRINSGTTA